MISIHGYSWPYMTTVVVWVVKQTTFHFCYSADASVVCEKLLGTVYSSSHLFDFPRNKGSTHVVKFPLSLSYIPFFIIN